MDNNVFEKRRPGTAQFRVVLDAPGLSKQQRNHYAKRLLNETRKAFASLLRKSALNDIQSGALVPAPNLKGLRNN